LKAIAFCLAVPDTFKRGTCGGFSHHLAAEGVTVKNVSEEYGGVAIFGPQSRELLARLSQADVSNEAFPFLTVLQRDLGFAPALTARLSVTGELGYEIYTPRRTCTRCSDR